ncbi:hypothetical protein ACFQ9X_27620 [Catenulispora yoronensis]
MHTAHPRGLSPTEVGDFLALIGKEREQRLREAARRIRKQVGAGTLWHVNSTAPAAASRRCCTSWCRCTGSSESRCGGP